VKNSLSDWSKEQLIAEIKRLKKRKKFGLVWEDKPEDVAERCKSELPVLIDVTEREISGDSKTTNILIEGDNYHALSVLNYTHKGKIDVIYIDPPYNTGARDWKYNNDYVDENDSYRHSKWLSFMEKRIKLAKTLLRPSGVFICTIDENEHSSLGLLLQEIFFDREIVCVTIIHNPGGIQGKNFSYCHEYAYFVYPAGGTYISTVERNDIDPTPLRDWGKESSKRKAAKTCFYPIYVKDGEVLSFGDVCPDKFHPGKANILRKDGVVEVYPIDRNGIERKWRFSRNSIEGIKKEILCRRLKDELVIVRAKTNYRWKTVWDDGRYNANVYGTQLLNSIIKTTFPFPKSLYAVEDCIKAVMHNKDNALILDFFAGSGTTGHAVLNLNKNDNGTRRFILCTNNENQIAENVCYPRIKNISIGYKDSKGEKVNGLGGNLKYFRTDFVDAEPTDKNKKRLTLAATEMLCLKEDAFEQVANNKKGFKIFKNADHYMGIVFDQMAIQDFKDAIRGIKGRFSVYVFSLGDDSFEEEFEDLEQKVTLSPIPEAILRVYRRIFRG
jgi:adenine-specific DNA-methyltransferase